MRYTAEQRPTGVVLRARLDPWMAMLIVLGVAVAMAATLGAAVVVLPMVVHFGGLRAVLGKREVRLEYADLVVDDSILWSHRLQRYPLERISWMTWSDGGESVSSVYLAMQGEYPPIRLAESIDKATARRFLDAARMLPGMVARVNEMP